MDIPEYYRKFQTPKKDKASEEKVDEQQQKQPTQPQTQQKPEVQKSAQAPQTKDKTKLYQGNGFTLNQLEDWQDKTLYTITGPVTDGIQHNIIISVDQEPAFKDLVEYAEWHIKTMEKELKSCMLLKKNETKLADGTDAYEAIFSWYPTDQIRIYQHQIFVLVEKAMYKMTASFTKKTRKTIGPSVERMMLSFKTTR